MVKLEIGQKVTVQEHGNTREGTVTKVGRVWCEIQMYPGGYPYRFRMDTQDVPGAVGSGVRFYTLEQWAEREVEMEATTLLKAQGILLDYDSPWRGKSVQLAAILKAGGVS